MRKRRKTILLLLLGATLALIISACGGGDASPQPAPATPAEPAPAPAPQPVESEPSDPQPAEPPSEPAEPPSEPAADTPAAVDTPFSFSLGDGWQATLVDEGIKPDIALDANGSPALTYLREDIPGWIKFAAATEDWQPELIAEGYFYGPIGVAFDGEGRPNVAWHDHQANSVDLALGDLTHSVRDGAAWSVTSVEHPGHDGWDSTIAIGSDGVVRAAGIEPAQFGFDAGLEYYELGDDGWTVTEVGSGPIAYEFNVSLAVAPAGLPAISYYNDSAQELIFVSFDGSSWSAELVTAEGDPGRFSSLAFGAEGVPHLTFYDLVTGSAGTIRYAVKNSDEWSIEEIAPLESVVLGQTGARRNSSLALAADGTPHVAFADTSGVWYAVRSNGVWDVQQVAEAADRPFGQLVSLALDAADAPHLAFTELIATGPLNGLIVYASLAG